MNEKNLKINLWVGIFSFVILIASALFTVLFLGKMNPFQSSLSLVINFDNVEGLKVGSNVNLEGFTIGRVISIHLSKTVKKNRPRHQVTIKIIKSPEYLKWITYGSKFQIVNDNFFGEKHVDITFNSKGKPIQDMDELEGIQTASINEILRNLQRITKGAEDLLDKVGGVTGEVGGENLVSTFRSVQETIQNFSQFSKKLKVLLGDKSSFNMELTLKNIDQTSRNLSTITNTVNKLLQKDSKGITSSIHDLQKAMGNFENISKTLETQLGGKKGKNLLLLLRDGVRDFSKTSKNLSKLTEGMNQSLNATSKNNVDLTKTMKDLQAGAENLHRITERILDTMDAPNKFFSRIFGKKKKKK